MSSAIPVLAGERVQENVPARRLTTFGVGGAVRYLVEPASSEELIDTVEAAVRSGTPFRILGNGSNVVIPDEGFPGTVIRLGRAFEAVVRPETEDARSLSAQIPALGSESVFVYAGAPMMSLSRKLSQEGRAGLEFAAGIPGTLGGAVKMNAGAHGSQLSDVLEGAWVLRRGETVFLSKGDLDFRYRHSSIGAEDFVIGAVLKLPSGDVVEIQSRRQECLEYRKRTQPLHLPSAGSVFRNPASGTGPALAAAALLEQAGLKGRRSGGVAYSEMHSNWLVRVDDTGRSAEVRELIELGQSTVQRLFGVELIPEILLW